MGGVVSTGEDNDELVDKLKEADYIRTPCVEKVFRLVDRADYVTREDKKLAYRDSAWRSGNLHLSAPCIYAQAMEGLDVSEGMSFLNIGSGTGYLSTMAGLLLGPKGTSHGIELHSDVIEYAHERLDWFRLHSGALDVLQFCEPAFIQGNAFCLPDDHPQYDRVYCGAACSDTHEGFMKELLKINGILVMPLNEQLLKITRTSETKWQTESLLPVTFSQLVTPDPTHPPATLQLPPAMLYSLQDLCRREIRRILLYLVEEDNPSLKESFNHDVKITRNSKSECSGLGMLFSEVPSEDEDHSDTENQDYPFDSHRLVVNHILELRRSIVTGRSLGHIDHASSIRRMQCSEEVEHSADENNTLDDNNELNLPEVDVEMREAEGQVGISTQDKIQIIESDQELENSLSNEEIDASPKEPGENFEVDHPSTSLMEQKSIPSIIMQGDLNNANSEDLIVKNGNNSSISLEKESNDTMLESNSNDAHSSASDFKSCEEEEDSLSNHSVSSNSSNKRSRDIESSKELMELEEPKKREKFDSGVGDEIEGEVGGTSPEDLSEGDERESESDDSDNIMPAYKLFSVLSHNPRHHKWKKRSATRSSDSQGSEEQKKPKSNPAKKYSTFMQDKIQLLPLPLPLKIFVNYNREM